MVRIAVAAALLCSAALGVSAQSVVTLESFDLDAPDSGEAAQSEAMRDCLLRPERCGDDGFASGASISLNDVVNLGIIDREQVADVDETAAAEPLPSIDIEILFEFASDDLTPQSLETLAQLTAALRDPRITPDTKLLFIGHTDAVGSVDANLSLSRRRAETVARHVQAALLLPPSRVEAVGVGFSRLKNALDPEAAENRRVQLVLVPAGA